MATAIVLIGVPGSGKSTLARALAQQSPTTLVINPDRVRQQLYGDAAIQGDWAEIWREIEGIFAQASTDRRDLIYDATNYRAEYRRTVITSLRQYNFNPIKGWWLNEPLWICLMRNQQRDRQVSEAVIIEMYKQLQLEPPSLAEGFDHLLSPLVKNESEWMD